MRICEGWHDVATAADCLGLLLRKLCHVTAIFNRFDSLMCHFCSSSHLLLHNAVELPPLHFAPSPPRCDFQLPPDCPLSFPLALSLSHAVVVDLSRKLKKDIEGEGLC
jgi:hypothetical protein